jgi:hypothetical protein
MMHGFWVAHLYGVIYIRAWTRREARHQAWVRGYKVWATTPRKQAA